MINISNEKNTCRDGRSQKAFKEHGEILKAIVEGDEDKAVEAMMRHMDMTEKQFVNT